MLFEAIEPALSSIRRNALRSFLTELGIAIGVGVHRHGRHRLGHHREGDGGSVQARKRSALRLARAVRSQLCEFGCASLQRARCRNHAHATFRIRAVAPVVQKSVMATYGNESRTTTPAGTENEVLITQNRALTSGRSFLDGEEPAGRATCIIGQTVRDKLFGHVGPLESSIRINKISCEVIGVLKAKGGRVSAPTRTTRSSCPCPFQCPVAGNTDIGRVYVSARDDADPSKVQASIEHLLRKRRGITGDGFTLRGMKQVVQTMAGTTAVLTGQLGALAPVFLLVGGNGIMNIMFVLVTEHTREIGIRLAVGALEGQVLLQFLAAAVVLSLVGGIVGILLGLGPVAAANVLQVSFLIGPSIILMAIGRLAPVGVVFGYCPARRAARFDRAAPPRMGASHPAASAFPFCASSSVRASRSLTFFRNCSKAKPRAKTCPNLP
ncbi:ABC transporter permease [Microvirga makkahensis]|uniref:ABC transporter permease n=1 Tax=Microvirga makkahensis TaxID=1128670 RepID=A0A7X3MPZ3_9HYPH|nr:ABC transporter permease [Microvirga makkahensis]